MADWSKAPYWANFAAMDSNGDWWWHEKRPIANDEFWFQPGVSQRFGWSPTWRETLSGRSTQSTKQTP